MFKLIFFPIITFLKCLFSFYLKGLCPWCPKGPIILPPERAQFSTRPNWAISSTGPKWPHYLFARKGHIIFSPKSAKVSFRPKGPRYLCARKGHIVFFRPKWPCIIHLKRSYFILKVYPSSCPKRQYQILTWISPYNPVAAADTVVLI